MEENQARHQSAKGVNATRNEIARADIDIINEIRACITTVRLRKSASLPQAVILMPRFSPI